MLNISPQWTTEERLIVIGWLGLIYEVGDDRQRRAAARLIYWLTSWTPADLEAQRLAILATLRALAHDNALRTEEIFYDRDG
jgi:hypothetical protein